MRGSFSGIRAGVNIKARNVSLSYKDFFINYFCKILVWKSASFLHCCETQSLVPWVNSSSYTLLETNMNPNTENGKCFISGFSEHEAISLNVSLGISNKWMSLSLKIKENQDEPAGRGSVKTHNNWLPCHTTFEHSLRSVPCSQWMFVYNWFSLTGF